MASSRSCPSCGQQGFTLIELMVTVGVVAILAAIAAPSFQDLLGRYRADAAATELKATLDLARSEAIKRVVTAQVCPSSNGSSCTASSTNWASGWLVWADANSNGSLDSGEVTQVGAAVNSSLTFTSSASTVTFQSLGQITGTVPTFTVTHTASAVSRYVCLSASGSSKVQTTSC